MKKKYIIALYFIAALLVVTTTIGATYGVWNVEKTQTTENEFSAVDCFSLVFNDEASATINLRNSYPLTDERGQLTTPYTFTLKNECSTNIPYKVILNTINTSVNFGDQQKLEDKYVRLSVSGAHTLNPATLSELTTLTNVTNNSNVLTSYELFSGVMEPGDTVNSYSLRLWVTEDVDGTKTNPDGSIVYGTNAMNKAFEAMLMVKVDSSY